MHSTSIMANLRVADIESAKTLYTDYLVTVRSMSTGQESRSPCSGGPDRVVPVRETTR